jgi:hypothetical protein
LALGASGASERKNQQRGLPAVNPEFAALALT